MVVICTESFDYCSTNNTNNYDEYFNLFSPIILSSFQKWAIKAIVDKDNVLITAHTGSGKTLPAEFAIRYFAEKRKKIIYASPIKALSNQKLYDFRRKFPTISFGILTGDCKDNPDANVLIMTTEILRNTLFNKKINMNVSQQQASTDVNTEIIPLSFEMDFENDLAAVIFDEVHYINDIERGSVWEQSILLLPPQVQLIMLSATIDKPESFANWIETEKKKQSEHLNIPVKNVYLASTYERVVPLTHYMWLSMPSKTFKCAKDKPIEKKLPELHNIPIVIADSNGTYNETNYYRVQNALQFMNNNNIYGKRQHILDELLRYLNKNSMLPAICFIFSRKHVEQTAKEISFSLFEEHSPLPGLVEKECRYIISSKLPNYEEYINLPEYIEIIHLLKKGIAIHHAGIMPVLREMVELLFEKGFVKLLFATETFAVGLNMPTKTVIFTGLTKYNGSTMRLLYPHEYTQMAGRAGRRGLDTIGHVFHCNNLFEMPLNTEYKNMLTGPPQTLISKFKISFNLILNILSTHHTNDYSIIERFVEQSLLSSDIRKELLHYDTIHQTLEKQLISTKEILSTCKTPEKTMIEYNNKLALLPITQNSAKKKLRSEMNTIETEYKTLETDLKKFASYNEIINKIEQNDKEKNNTSTYIYSTISQIVDILKTSDFIYIDSDICLTNKGKIASQLQEIHSLAFADIYHITNGFDNLTSIDLVALFSCFSSISVSDEVKTHTPKTYNTKLNTITLQLFNLLEKYYSLESRSFLDTGSSYDIHYDLMNYVIKWCESTCEEDCKMVINSVKVEKNIFLGEFVKAILKINNISKEFEKVCELMNNMTLLGKLKEIPMLTLKYVVTSQSLYV